MDEALHKAIVIGNFTLVKELIEKGAGLNHSLGMKGTPLCAAIYSDKPELVNLLLHQNCDVNAKDYDGEPPLCLAIRTSKHDIIKQLLNAPSCDLNRMDPLTGYRPIHLAVRSRNYEVLLELVSQRCNLNMTDKSGQTAICVGISMKEYAIVKLLIDSGCSLFMMNNEGDIPLMVAIKSGENNLMRLILDKMLVDCGDAKQTVLDYQAPGTKNTPLVQAIIADNLDAAFELIKRGCDVNIRNCYNETALYLSCKFNHQDLICCLLQADANPSTTAADKRIHHVPNTAKTPIHEAIHIGNLFVVKKLVEYGADLNAVDGNGNDALCCALFGNKSQIVDFILEFVGNEPSKLSQDFRRRNHPLVAVASCNAPAHFANRLVAFGFDPNYRNLDDSEYYLNTPLMNAIDFDCIQLVEVLLASGADAGIQCGSLSALEVAASVGSIGSVASLIQWGADVSRLPKRDPSESALGLALANGNMNIARLLLECGCTLTNQPLDAHTSVDAFDLENYCMDEEIEEIKTLLAFNTSNARPLMCACRDVIISRIKVNARPLSAVIELPLPSKLKSFLRYKELDSFKFMEP